MHTRQPRKTNKLIPVTQQDTDAGSTSFKVEEIRDYKVDVFFDSATGSLMVKRELAMPTIMLLN